MHATKVRYSNKVRARSELHTFSFESYCFVDKPFVISIVGAESSGKTSLALDLAQFFQCPLISEYAREYLTQLQRPYNENDLQLIAEKQIEILQHGVLQESDRWGIMHSKSFGESHSPETRKLFLWIREQVEARYTGVVIVDGGVLNLKLWASIKFNSKIEAVDQALQNDVTDLYILCRPRYEWSPDPLREAPDLLTRAWIYNHYLKELSNGNVPFEIFSSD